MTLHIVYLYVENTSPKQPVKGGTFVEAVFDNISYLPYIGNAESDELYKSFLFKSCLTPSLGNEQIVFKEDLCEVKTDNYKTFYVSVKTGAVWNDSIPVNINDVFFTYNDILKNNIWNRKQLEGYKNIDITLLSGDKIKVEFSKSSIDNQLFLTNYILPKHVLEGKTADDYIQIYSKTPVLNGCGSIKGGSKDQQSIVFDLTKCENYYIKYYQLKKFNTFDELKKYTDNGNKNIIDTYIGNNYINNFENNQVILNKLIAVFFNSNSSKLNYNIRKALTEEIYKKLYTGDYTNYLVKDNFLFDKIPTGGNLEKSVKDLISKTPSNTQKVSTGTVQTNTVSQNTQSTEIANLPSVIALSNKTYTYYLSEIKEGDMFGLKFKLDKGLDKISIARVGVQEYFLKSYKAGDTTATYNLGSKLNNIDKGENKYVIKGYRDNKLMLDAMLVVNYITKPQSNTTSPQTDTGTQQNLTGNTTDTGNEEITISENKKITVIYFTDDINKYIAGKIENIIKEKNLSEYFEFIEFSSAEQFENRINAGDYEIVIGGLDTGYKKDISDIFAVDSAMVNPSNYKSNDLSSLVNQYFISSGNVKEKVKKEIDNIYTQQIPFMFIGKPVSNINVRQQLDFSYPFKLYGYGLRKDLLGQIQIIFKPIINTQKLVNYNQFKSFITQELK